MILRGRVSTLWMGPCDIRMKNDNDNNKDNNNNNRIVNGYLYV